MTALKRIMPADMVEADLENLKRACASSYCGFGTTDILQGALGLGLQLWRWGGSGEDSSPDGIIVTRIEQFPGGKQLLVLMLAGRGFRAGLEPLWREVFYYAKLQGCRWVAGCTDQEKLIEAYEEMAPAEHFHYMVYEVESDKGLAPWVEVATPEGPRTVAQLAVGDMVAGPGGPQRVVAVWPGVRARVLADGVGAGMGVRGADGTWHRAADIAPGNTTTSPAIEITVEPDHEFLLADGRTVHNKGGGGGGGDSESTTTTKPWWGQREPLLNAYERADQAFEQSQDLSGPSAQDVASAQADAAQGAGMGADQIRQNALASARGDFLSPDSNPYLQGQVDAALGQVNENFQQNVLPGIQDSASKLGAYGGSRQGIAEARAMDDLNSTAADVASNIYYNNYVSERQNQLNAAQQLLGANQVALQPGMILNDAYTSSQTLPFLGAQQYAQLVQGGPAFKTSNTESSSAGKSGGASFLQGAAGGAATGASLGSVIPGVGTGIGAGVGGVLGGASSLF